MYHREQCLSLTICFGLWKELLGILIMKEMNCVFKSTYYMQKVYLNLICINRNVMFLCVLFVACTVYGQQRFLTEHPRLLFTKAETVGVKTLIKKNPQVYELAEFLKAKADSFLGLPQIEYELNRYGNILYTSRSYVERLGTLALSYRIYNEQKYLDAANDALLWVCAYPDWDPKHYLDTAEMTTAVAIAYDWLYDMLPQATKNIVKHCLYERAVCPVLREYEKGGSGSWAKRETNWNVVCNAGMTLAALAIAEDYPQEAATILDNTAKYMPNCLKHFAPDGVCYEGPSYWGFTSSYLSLYLKAVEDNDCGRGGIARLPGIERTALYYKRALTPTGRIFNFANAHNEPLNTPAFFLFSQLYHQPEVAEWFRDELKQTIGGNKPLHQLFFLSLPWYDASSGKSRGDVPSLEVYHNTINDILVFNGDRNKQGSIYLIAKGGEPRQAHQQMDCGTFIVETDGVCWTDDLGSDDYTLPGFWDYRPGGQRWKYFRNSNLSHNTLSIDHKIQHASGEAFVCEERPDAERPYARLDMTSLYRDQASSVFRKFTLLDDYTMEVEDEVRLLDARSVVSWTAITKASVEVDGNKLHLTHHGKHFYMEILSPSSASFKTYPAVNTCGSEYPIHGFNMIEAECEFGGKSGSIVVRMSSKKL